MFYTLYIEYNSLVTKWTYCVNCFSSGGRGFMPINNGHCWLPTQHPSSLSSSLPAEPQFLSCIHPSQLSHKL